MTAAGRPWSRRSASAGDALLRPRLSRRPAQLSLPLRPAARPELRRVPDRPHARGARDPAWHRSGARAVVRRRVLAGVRGAGRHRISIGGLAGAVASMDRAQRRRPRDPVRPVSAWPAPPGVPDARAQGPARPQARGYVGSAVVGVTFGAAWTPCIGPILGAILTLAAAQASVGHGAALRTASFI